MNFITRNQQVEEELPETYVKYPHLIPYLQKVQDKSTKHMYPFQVTEYFTRTQNDLTKNYYQQIINRTIRVIHYILSSSYNILLKSNNRAGVSYLIFTDTRMGSISMDFSSAAANPLLAKYSISTKHRIDLDPVVNNLHNPDVVVHVILDYCNSIVEYAKQKHITNDFIFYNESTSKYCKVGLDEVEESNYKQVVVFLENYWTKVPTKSGTDILDKTSPFSKKVYISQIDYIKE
jgi:hypothetical protein